MVSDSYKTLFLDNLNHPCNSNPASQERRGDGIDISETGPERGEAGPRHTRALERGLLAVTLSYLTFTFTLPTWATPDLLGSVSIAQSPVTHHH